jgi:molecular chaperone DnaK
MMRDAESHSADDARKRDEIEARNRLDGLTYQMEKTLNDNREKAGAVAGDVESAIAEAKKALAEGGLEKLNDAYNQLQTASHKLAEVLYQQSATPGGETADQASAAGAGTTSSSGGEDNVIDAEYVDVDDKK